jgi:hypothetical protein
MFTVRTWCLPNLSQQQLKRMHEQIVSAVVSIPSAGVTKEEEMLDLFPSDQMEYGLGEEVVIEVIDCPSDCDTHQRVSLGKKLNDVVAQFLQPGAHVTCKIIASHPGDVTV